MQENDEIQVENSKSTLLIGGEISKIEQEKNEDNISEKNDKSNVEKNLIYKIKKVSIFKLLCHLSGKLEIFLMIIGTISTFFSGCSYSLWGLLLGDTINDLSDTIDLDNLPEEQYNKEFEQIEKK